MRQVDGDMFSWLCRKGVAEISDFKGLPHGEEFKIKPFVVKSPRTGALRTFVLAHTEMDLAEGEIKWWVFEDVEDSSITITLFND
jgi:hypothetical protein